MPGLRNWKQGKTQNRLNATLDLISRGFTGKVKARQGHLLDLEFENGEKRVFDMRPYLDKRPFNQLKNSPLFDLATVGMEQ